MQVSFEFDVDPFDVASTLPQMVNEWRKEVALSFDEWGQEMTSIAFELSPSDKQRHLDKTKEGEPRRRKESEAFKNFWEYQVSFDGVDPKLEIGNTDPKMPYIVFETQGGATITPKTKDYLVFYWFSRGNWNTKFSVTKGRTPGQPVHEWTINEFNIDQHLSDLVR